MLKLEKISKTRELNVLLRDKPNLITASFLMALAYALFIHLAALLIFQVAPLKMHFQNRLFPPVTVSIEHPAASHVYIELEDEPEIPTYLIVPLPSLPKISMSLETPLMSQFPPWSIYLSSSSKEDKAAKRAEITVFLSGGIADLNLIPNEKNIAVSDSNHSMAANNVSHFFYKILVDQSQGEMIWWEMSEWVGDTTLQAQALEALKSLRFVPRENGEILSGEVEVLIDQSQASIQEAQQ